jgi:hypothetical protein
MNRFGFAPMHHMTIVVSSAATVQIAHNVLVRAIRQAERDDLTDRNVAALVKPPKGKGAGRPSKSLTLEQAVALMAAARGTRLVVTELAQLPGAQDLAETGLAQVDGGRQAPRCQADGPPAYPGHP